jgi:hypothetical protein
VHIGAHGHWSARSREKARRPSGGGLEQTPELPSPLCPTPAGLWSLLEPVGRRIQVETLANQTLAVGNAQLASPTLRAASHPLACTQHVPHSNVCVEREGGAPVESERRTGCAGDMLLLVFHSRWIDSKSVLTRSCLHPAPSGCVVSERVERGGKPQGKSNSQHSVQQRTVGGHEEACRLTQHATLIASMAAQQLYAGGRKSLRQGGCSETHHLREVVGVEAVTSGESDSSIASDTSASEPARANPA